MMWIAFLKKQKNIVIIAIILIVFIIIKKSCQSLEEIDLHRKKKNGAKLIKFKIDNYYFL